MERINLSKPTEAELDRLNKEKTRKQKFITDLKNQIGDNEAKNNALKEEMKEMDRQNPNILIDDTLRAQKKKAMNDHNRDNLL